MDEDIDRQNVVPQLVAPNGTSLFSPLVMPMVVVVMMS